MNVTIRPGTARGAVRAPASKSIGHRALIAAALADGTSEIRGLTASQDILASLDCLNALGVWTKRNGDDVSVKGIGGRTLRRSAGFPCRESGSTLRFFLPVVSALGITGKFTGSPVLMGRPMGPYEELLPGFTRLEDGIRVSGKLSAGTYRLPGGLSSQFVTGLLFALPLTGGESRIELVPPVESRPYIDLSIDVLRDFGVVIEEPEPNVFAVPAGAAYHAKDLQVEGDYSGAAFLDVFNHLGGEVFVEGLTETSAQGDAVYRELFPKLAGGYASADIAQCPDLGPVLIALAALCHGGEITGTRRLRIKESDRGSAMAEEIRKMGGSVIVEENRILIEERPLHAPAGQLFGHGDHRIVMALAVMLTKLGGSIRGAEAADKSFPGFFDKLGELGIEVSKDGMDQ